MKLYYSDTSPYSRKVRLVIIEKGLDDDIQKIKINPFEDNPELWAVNPLGKIPALELDYDETLFDSPVICRYLDRLSKTVTTPLLIPSDGWSEWDILRWEALADGMTDAAYNLVMERRRPSAEQSKEWIARWASDIHRVLSEIESRIDELDNHFTLAQLALGAAVGYIDFRLAEMLYESVCPQVAKYPAIQAWYEVFKTRSSMIATKPAE
ncbi:MAG: glutathione S-transferase N-terminal domain-containing protein [Thiotrichaceae bacterium]